MTDPDKTTPASEPAPPQGDDPKRTRDHVPQTDSATSPSQCEFAARLDAVATASAAPDANRTQAHSPEQTAAVAVSASTAVAVPGYAIVAELGRGGMGVVYRARDTRLNREVALKMILRADTGRVAVARFWAEAEVMAAVKHPHVVQVFELGEHDGRPFIAMELVSGGSLADLLKASGSLPSQAAAELLEKIARGVAAAHELGIVHRDLKPGNVLLSADGTPKITDFGLAKRQANDLTATQALMGTPAYMAPEQAAGRAKFVGPPADVWALGVMLYESLAGKRPFKGDTAATLLSQIQSAEPTALRTRRRSTPRDLDTITMKCLAKEAEHRYPSAAELADDLGRFVRGEPIAARPVGRIERFARWVRRKPTAAAAWGFSSLTVVLALVVFVVLGFWREAEGAKVQADDARTRVEGLLGTETKLLGELQGVNGKLEWALASERTAKGKAEAAKGEAEKARKRVEELLAAETRLKGELQTANGALERALADEKEAAKAAEIARDAADKARVGEAEARKQVEREREKLAALEYGRTIQVAHQEWRDNNISGALTLLESTKPHLRGWEWRFVHRLCNNTLLTIRGHTGGLSSASFSPDGARIVTGSSDGTAKVWDARTGAELLTLRGHGGGVGSVSFSPDGLRLATGSDFARVWDAKTGSEVATLRRHNKSVTSVSFSPDGSRVLTAGSDGIAVWDFKADSSLVVATSSNGPFSSAAFNSDGSRVVTGGGLEGARVWDVKKGTEVKELAAPAYWVSAAEFSPDGTRMATAGSNGVWVWEEKPGGKPIELKGHTERVNAVRFNSDGSRLVTAGFDKTARVWDTKTGEQILVLTGHTDLVNSAVFSRDDSQIVTASKDGTARVWDAKSGTGQISLWQAHMVPFNGQDVLTHFGNSKPAREYDSRTGASLRTLNEGRTDHRDFYWDVNWSPDGARLVTRSIRRGVVIWDARTGEQLLALKAARHSGAFSPEGGYVLADGKIWDAKTGGETVALKERPGSVPSEGAFSPDSTRVVLPTEGSEALVFDAKTGMKLLVLSGHTGRLTSASFSPDGSRVVTSSRDGTARVWDARTGTELHTLSTGKSSVWSASFSPDGSRVVTAHWDRTARVWDTNTGAELFALKGHTDVVISAFWNPDQSRLLTVGLDGTARVWESKSGAEMVALRGHTDPVRSAYWSRDGSQIVTFGLMGSLWVWDSAPRDRQFAPKNPAPPPRMVGQ